MNAPPIITIPKLSAEERKGMQAYWNLYEKHREAISLKLMEMASQHDEIKFIMQSMPTASAEEQAAALERQRRAIFQNEWEPYLQNLQVQGTKYAEAGLSFQSWFDIVGSFRTHMMPYLLHAYSESPEELLSAINGMDCLVDIAMSTIGNSYLDTKQRLIQKQGEILDESERKFAIMFEKAPFAAALSKLPDGVIVNINEEFEQAFGFTREEVTGKTSLELGLHPDAQARARILAQIQEHGTARNVEARLQTKSGVSRIFLLNIDTVTIDGEKYTLQTAQDITERKQTEEALRASEERFATAFRASPDAMIISRLSDGTIIDVNEGWARLFGHEQSEVRGQIVTDLGIYVNPEDRETAVKRLQETGLLRDFETGVRRNSGEIRQASLSGEKIEVDNTECLLLVIHDITEQKESQERLSRLNEELEHRVAERTQELKDTNEELEIVNRQLQKKIREREQVEKKFRGLLESAPDAIIVVDQQGIIQLINTQTEKLFGYSSDELLGQSIEVLVPKRFGKKHVKHREGYYVEHPARPMGIGLELFGLRKNGTEFPVEISLSPLESEEGLLVSAAIRDVTQRRRIEEEIRKLNEDLKQRAAQLEASNKELESFSYSVSHDLRAPLRSIDGFSQALLEDFSEQLPAEARDYLERVRNAAQRMGVLIDDLLNLSRITRATLQPKFVNLSAIAQEVADTLREGDPERRVETSIMPDLMVDGDPHLLHIALQNLLSNAWKFTSKQEHAKVEFGQLPRHNHKPRTFYVRDNGVGFDMAYADKLFGVFQRLHSISQFPGTGVGLATVRRIITIHGGQIWAESAEGKGTTFYFTL